MSGIKESYVQLRNTEIDRLLDTCESVDDLEGHIEQRLTQASKHFRHELDRHLTEVETRQQAFEQSLTSLGLGEAIQAIERQYTEQLQKLAQAFQQQITEQLQQGGGQYAQLIQQKTREFTNALSSQHTLLHQELTQVSAQVHAQHTTEAEQAEQWVTVAQALLTFLQTQYARHTQFLPFAIQKLQGELLLAQTNLVQKNYQAVIANSQQTWLAAQNLRLQLEQKEVEWQAYLHATRYSVLETLTIIEAQAQLNILVGAGSEEATTTVDVDFWTKGKYAKLHQQIQATQWQLDTGEFIPQETLQQILAQMGAHQQTLANLVAEAKEGLLASQLRNNIGQMIEEALYDAGWEVTDAAYEGEDYREAMHLKLKNFQGDEIVTIINPDPNADYLMRNKLNILFFDRSSNDDTSRQERLKHIIRVLRAGGLECTQPVCVAGTENQASMETERLDFSQVRKGNNSRLNQQSR
ncbi:hypothetical protein [Beggiatoa leptomitoformis]|uniref:Uncharacterized protein n=1 Tax=Beggiatoa leptomitoformis TaxID=288004 RepID=A0A2N9YD59_9GAMM|nr:hypothetical protein [Beggiatoa leptomitoformis]ALG69174.1 hypothetical protein AL038_17640 [Beggiatoa leptomitoformis]AUI68400.1 hypothetical protein BLE401_06590 [Beggiatoa leptomitoformis]